MFLQNCNFIIDKLLVYKACIDDVMCEVLDELTPTSMVKLLEKNLMFLQNIINIL
jgi:hypothetical protein